MSENKKDTMNEINPSPNSKWSKASIVVLNWNRKNLTVTCLKSLEKLTYPNYNVIVVDNGSTDGSQDLIKEKFPYVTLIENEKNLGFAKGMNIGIREALKNDADYVFTLNNDTKDFSPNYFEEILRAFEEDDMVGLVGSVCYDYEGKMINSGEPKYKFGLKIITPTEGYVIKREIFEKVGVFDEALNVYIEDLDLIARLEKAGYKTKVVTSVSFAHLGGGSGYSTMIFPTFYRVRNLFWFLRKYCGNKPLWWKLARSFGWLSMHFERLIYHLIRLQLKSFILVFYYILCGIAVGLITKWEHKNQL